jgi:hypothetical protein
MLPHTTPPVYAAARYVDHLAGTDSGNCLSFPGCRTIGYAISQASNGDSITIVGHLSADVYTENLTINKSLQFIGMTADPSLIVIDGNGSVTGQRVITVTTGITVYLSGVTIRNGRINGSSGAGIWNQGTLILDSSVVTGNQVTGVTSSDVGGGIVNNGTLTVTNSTIGNNSADRGGGIFNAGSAFMVLSNTQIISNQARSGGGLVNFGNQAQLTNVTVDGNTATNNTGGIYNATGFVLTLDYCTVGYFE